jgi:hypothetical protein
MRRGLQGDILGKRCFFVPEIPWKSTQNPPGQSGASSGRVSGTQLSVIPQRHLKYPPQKLSLRPLHCHHWYKNASTQGSSPRNTLRTNLFQNSTLTSTVHPVPGNQEFLLSSQWDYCRAGQKNKKSQLGCSLRVRTSGVMFHHRLLNSLSAKSVLAGEKLVATYSIST